MADGGGFSPAEVVALLDSHTIMRSDKVDPAISAVPFESAPFTFDSQIFFEVLLKGTGFSGTGNDTGEVVSPLPKVKARPSVRCVCNPTLLLPAIPERKPVVSVEGKSLF